VWSAAKSHNHIPVAEAAGYWPRQARLTDRHKQAASEQVTYEAHMVAEKIYWHTEYQLSTLKHYVPRPIQKRNVADTRQFRRCRVAIGFDRVGTTAPAHSGINAHRKNFGSNNKG